MKIELIFTKRSNGFDDEQLLIGKFSTKKSAYQYIKANRKFFCDGYFSLCITKKYDYYFESVNAQDILKV